jgi:hypothetical protein
MAEARSTDASSVATIFAQPPRAAASRKKSRRVLIGTIIADAGYTSVTGPRRISPPECSAAAGSRSSPASPPAAQRQLLCGPTFQPGGADLCCRPSAGEPSCPGYTRPSHRTPNRCGRFVAQRRPIVAALQMRERRLSNSLRAHSSFRLIVPPCKCGGTAVIELARRRASI